MTEQNLVGLVMTTNTISIGPLALPNPVLLAPMSAENMEDPTCTSRRRQ